MRDRLAEGNAQAWVWAVEALLAKGREDTICGDGLRQGPLR